MVSSNLDPLPQVEAGLKKYKNGIYGGKLTSVMRISKSRVDLPETLDLLSNVHAEFLQNQTKKGQHL